MNELDRERLMNEFCEGMIAEYCLKAMANDKVFESGGPESHKRLFDKCVANTSSALMKTLKISLRQMN